MAFVVQCLQAVIGHDQRCNDVILALPRSFQDAPIPLSEMVIYFGGDVQDYTERMKENPRHEKYAEYSLEATAVALAEGLGCDCVMVIRPGRVELRTFSCYDNFIACDKFGNPSKGQTKSSSALTHLARILRSVEQGRPELDLSHCCFTLVGFSKGCTVLNQVVLELHTAEGSSFPTSQIKKMVWLDGGHSGGEGVWITAKEILTSLAKLDVTLEVHVTPYQVCDDERPWIGREEKLFCTILKKLGSKITRTLHFAGEPPSLDNHFRLLLQFASEPLKL